MPGDHGNEEDRQELRASKSPTAALNDFADPLRKSFKLPHFRRTSIVVGAKSPAVFDIVLDDHECILQIAFSRNSSMLFFAKLMPTSGNRTFPQTVQTGNNRGKAIRVQRHSSSVMTRKYPATGSSDSHRDDGSLMPSNKKTTATIGLCREDLHLRWPMSVLK